MIAGAAVNLRLAMIAANGAAIPREGICVERRDGFLMAVSGGATLEHSPGVAADGTRRRLHAPSVLSRRRRLVAGGRVARRSAPFSGDARRGLCLEELRRVPAAPARDRRRQGGG